MDVAHSAQTLGGLLGRQVTLGFSQHFIADHKFTHRGGTQQRRGKKGGGLPVNILLLL